MCVFVHVCVCVCVCVCVRACVCMRACMCMCMCVSSMRMLYYICIHVCLGNPDKLRLTLPVIDIANEATSDPQ